MILCPIYTDRPSSLLEEDVPIFVAMIDCCSSPVYITKLQPFYHRNLRYVMTPARGPPNIGPSPILMAPIEFYIQLDVQHPLNLD